MPHTQREIFEALYHSPDATAIYNNKDLRIAYVNLKMLEIWDSTEEIVGSNFGDVFPEFREQGFEDILKHVWQTGEAYHATDRPADINLNGISVRHYFDFDYKPLQKDGQTYAILHTAREVSERMQAWETLQEKERIQNELNEELAASNEEILSYSEEYRAINEKLNETLHNLGQSYDELRHSHEKLMATENRAMYLLENAPVAIGVYDVLTESVISANQLFKEILALEHSEVQSPTSSFVSDKWKKILHEKIARVLSSGEVVNFLNERIGLDGSPRMTNTFYNLVLQPIKNSMQEIVTILIIANEVTDQKLQKETVDLALEQAQLAKRAAGFGVFDFDLASKKITCDDTCRAIMYLDRKKTITYEDDFIGRIQKTDKHRVLNEIKKAFEKVNVNNHVAVTFLLSKKKDGLDVWIKLVGQVYYDGVGRAKRFIGTISDVSEDMALRNTLIERENKLQQKNEELSATMEELESTNEKLLALNEDLSRSKEETEEAYANLKSAHEKLSRSEERLEIAIKSSQMGVWDVDFKRQTVVWDRRTREIFGVGSDQRIEYVNRWDFIHPEDLLQVQEGVLKSKTMSSNGVFSAQFRTVPSDSGSFRWVQLQGQIYLSATGQPIRFAGTIVDITERIVSQQQIEVINRSIEQKVMEQRMIVEAGKIGTYSYDLSNSVVATNRHFRTLMLLNDKELWTEKIFSYPQLLEKSSGGKSLAQIIAQEDNFDVECELCHSGNTNKRYLRWIGRRVTDSEQMREMVYGIVIDITLQKREEQRKMDFLGIVSHELKSPLTSLSGYIQILESRSSILEDSNFSKLLSGASRQTKQMKTLIEGFLDVARYGEGKLDLKLSKFDVQKLLNQITENYAQTLDSHKLIIHDAPSLTLEADIDKLEQVIVNLINNAIKYSPSGTTVTVETDLSDQHFYVRVKDQGPGISKENQEKIFSRFFRINDENTNKVGGFGIGLYICSEIIELHSGQIGVNSEEGHGATFWFDIPVLAR